MAKYFVTGATGFVGGEIVKQLIGRGHKVVALARAPERATMLRALGVELHAGDITDRETLKTPMEGVDGVFHVAAWYKIGIKEPLADQINVDGTRNVLQTMRTLEIPRGIYTSTLAVFSDTKGAVPDETYRYEGAHLSQYDRTKWIAHYRVAVPKMAEGLPLSIVMPGMVYGPGDTSGIHAALVDLLRGRLPMTPADGVLLGARGRHGAGPYPRHGAGQARRKLYHRRPAAHVRGRVRARGFAREGAGADVPSRPHHDARHGRRDLGGGTVHVAAARLHARGAARAGGHHLLRIERQGRA
jgi:nucleoside-diphosphate-sugar epimerase